MGDIDSAKVDFPAWTPAVVDAEAEKACKECGKLYFIPCITQGLNISSYPGVYEAGTAAIDKMNKKMF